MKKVTPEPLGPVPGSSGRKAAGKAGGKAAGNTRQGATGGKPATVNTTRPPRVRLAVDDRRSQLLTLGLAAFSERPYDAVAIDDIAADAGFSRGLLFHYFPTKREFYLACVELMARRLLETSFIEAPDSVPPAELPLLVMRGLEAYFAFVENHAQAFYALLNAGAVEGAEQIVANTRREFVTRLRAYLPPKTVIDERLVRAGLRAWVGLVEGIALDWVEHQDLPRDERVRLALEWSLNLPGAPLAEIVGLPTVYPGG